MLSKMSLDINLYAEFLMHTRSVTVCATVRKDSPTFKKAYVHADRQTVSILCDDVSSIIALPLGIEIKGSVGFPVSDPAEISLRLEIAEDGQPSHGLHMAVVNDVPWSAKRLTTQSQIACRSCSQTIVPAKQRIWKDLPRGSWAETLDQWYCHRPSKDHADGTPFLGAAEPMLDSDTALVDTCHFIILGEDCVDITVSPAYTNEFQCPHHTDSKKGNHSGVSIGTPSIEACSPIQLSKNNITFLCYAAGCKPPVLVAVLVGTLLLIDLVYSENVSHFTKKYSIFVFSGMKASYID